MGKIKLEHIEAETKRTRQFLSLSGMGCIYKWHLTYALYAFINGFSALSLLCYSLYYYKNQIDKIAVVVHHAILCMDVCIAAAVGYIWKDQFDIMLNDAYWSYNYKSELMLKKLNQIKEKHGKLLSRMFKHLLYSLIYLLLDIVILAICEKFLVKDETLLLFPCWFPFDLDNYPLYIAVIMWQEIIITHLGMIVFSSLGITYFIYSHVTTELEILQYAMKNIKERAQEMARIHMVYRENEVNNHNSEILKRCYIQCTKMCAEHHSEIIRYFNCGTTVMEIIYFLVFLSGLLVCTCTGFALISDNTALKVKFIGITIIEVIYLYMMCWAPEEMEEKSLAIGDIVYTMEWYTLPKECQSTLMVMTIRSNKPLTMRMLTGQKVDLAGYMALLKASYSYFNMMLATTQ